MGTEGWRERPPLCPWGKRGARERGGCMGLEDGVGLGEGGGEGGGRKGGRKGEREVRRVP